jgi:hypothetical protein
MALHRLTIAAAAVLLAAGCAVVSGARNDVIAGFCGVGAGDAWSRTEAPADASAYRQLALADPSLNGRRPRGDEYWFSNGSGETRFCVTPLERATFVPARNRTNCDERIGAWWDFRQTEAGPVTTGAAEHICLT